MIKYYCSFSQREENAMARIPKINLTHSGLSTTVQTIINTRDQKTTGEIMAGIPTTETLADVYGTTLPASTMAITSFVQALHQKTLQNFHAANAYLASIGLTSIPLPSGSAFNNCNGKWTEYVYAAFAWNSLANINRTNKVTAQNRSHDVYIYIKLPNRNSENNDWTQLLLQNITQALSNYPQTQSAKITSPANSNYGRRFELISSNPDAVILKYDSSVIQTLWQNTGITSFDLYSDISNLNTDTTTQLDLLFNYFRNTVLPSSNLQCFLSIKNSIRPDRRYQWVHEGDHIKTILQWIQVYSAMGMAPLDTALTYDDLNGKFFAVSLSHVSIADTEALNTGLVGSIVSPMLGPVWAVDKLISCTDFSQIDSNIHLMLNF